MNAITVKHLMDAVQQDQKWMGNPFTYVKGSARGRLLLGAAEANTGALLSLVDIDALECAHTHQDAFLGAIGLKIDSYDLEGLMGLGIAIRGLQSVLGKVDVERELVRLQVEATQWCGGGTFSPRLQWRHFLEEVAATSRRLLDEHQHALDELDNAIVHDEHHWE